MGYIFTLGFLFGLRHALDADHIAAVATLTTRAKSARQGVRLGVAWGLGHALTLFVVCAAVIATGAAISENFAGVLEFAVGVMLVGLGLDVIRRVVRDRVHAHAHRHDDGATHLHLHAHEAALAHTPKAHAHPHAAGLGRRALVIGLMHGLAGSAALLVLSVGALETAAYGLVYVALFGLGSMIGMAALSLTIALPMKYCARWVTWGYNGVHATVALASIALGGMVMTETGAPAAAWLGLG